MACSARHALTNHPGHTAQSGIHQLWLWPGLALLQAKGNFPDHAFGHNSFRQLPPMVVALTAAQQALNKKSVVACFWTGIWKSFT